MPLTETRADLRSDEWYDIASGKGVLILAELRKRMGDQPFLEFMDRFGREHSGRSTSTVAFFEAFEKRMGQRWVLSRTPG